MPASLLQTPHPIEAEQVKYKKNRKRHSIPLTSLPIPYQEKELWTAKQRQMHSLHYSISYRASFKPELPNFFIERYLIKENIPNAVVLDPFGGRGTTCLQANLRGFRAIHNDINPVSIFLAQARQNIPSLEALIKRTEELRLDKQCKLSFSNQTRFLPFFHKRTLNEIMNLRSLLQSSTIAEDPELAYIGLTALSRLHGHSDGFLSVYSFPQISISPVAQARNNLRRGEKPDYRSIKERIIRKLTRDLRTPIPATFHKVASKNIYLQENAQSLDSIPTNSVNLVVTSPPFLDKVDYQSDNWMRAWFLGVEEEASNAPITIMPEVQEWGFFMKNVMGALGRVLKRGGHAVIEVGEVSVNSKNNNNAKKQNLNLEEELLKHLPLKVSGGILQAKEVFINRQNFTKLSNCWAVSNNKKGTNTNRCLVLQKVAK